MLSALLITHQIEKITAQQTNLSEITVDYSKDTCIAYSGITGMITRNDYARIDGPSVWIEYSCQHGIILAGTHPHSVWRDRKTDYGSDK